MRGKALCTELRAQGYRELAWPLLVPKSRHGTLLSVTDLVPLADFAAAVAASLKPVGKLGGRS
jgi:hypothetical protein